MNENYFLPEIEIRKRSINKNLKNDMMGRRQITIAVEEYINIDDSLTDNLIKLVESRPRFALLVDFVKKFIKCKDKEIKPYFLINSFAKNDALIAVIYILHYLDRTNFLSGEIINFGKIFKIPLEGFGTYGYNQLPSNPMRGYKNEQITLQEEDDGEDDNNHDNDTYVPEWKEKLYPMFVEFDSFMQVEQKILKNDFPIIFVLDYFKNRKSVIAFFDEIGGIDSKLPVASKLAFSRYKLITIPKPVNAEYKKIFERCANENGLYFSKGTNIDGIIEEYIYEKNIFINESDILNAILSVKETKIFNDIKDFSITKKDFLRLENAKEMNGLDENKKEKNNPWLELNALIGNEKQKEEIRAMVDRLLIDKRREELDLPVSKIGMHAAFMGSPGTSKTSVARIIAKIFKYEDIIPSDNFKECTKSDIVGKYVGWTADNVDKIFSDLSATGGGILFLDEAYNYTDSQTAFDREAINCIVQNMENYRNIMVIFAGYKKEMQNFIEINPGIHSRISFLFDFPSYGIEEMIKITKYQADALGFEMPCDCEQILADYYANIMKTQGDYFGNGREARKLIEFATIELSKRICNGKGRMAKEKYFKLQKVDIEHAIEKALDREKVFDNNSKQMGFVLN